MSTYRIRIDRTLCSGFGSCADLEPEAFEVGPDGLALARIDETDEPAVLEAAASCPMGAIVAEAIEEAA